MEYFIVITLNKLQLHFFFHLNLNEDIYNLVVTLSFDLQILMTWVVRWYLARKPQHQRMVQHSSNPCYKLCKMLILRILLTFIYMPIILKPSKFSQLSKIEEKKMWFLIITGLSHRHATVRGILDLIALYWSVIVV